MLNCSYFTDLSIISQKKFIKREFDKFIGFIFIGVIIRNRTIKAQNGPQITGRGPPLLKRDVTLALKWRQTVLPHLRGLPTAYILAGGLPLPVILSALRALAGFCAHAPYSEGTRLVLRVPSYRIVRFT